MNTRFDSGGISTPAFSSTGYTSGPRSSLRCLQLKNCGGTYLISLKSNGIFLIALASSAGCRLKLLFFVCQRLLLRPNFIRRRANKLFVKKYCKTMDFICFLKTFLA
ncbi:hypothetical protein PR048_025064 [Dryococelus australis]|uniref:Uncharacterized protein n=1 Tax=Dryococelus australis TaxID=614101 RepID=A0ABQ9GQD3_9NEOP|nr:hypothetical protein PR048_025064 [Dryococelus australis]